MPTTVESIRSRSQRPKGVPLKQARFFIVCLFFLAWACAIGTRLFWLQIVRHKDFVERAQKQQQRVFQVAPRRGVLYDRNMRELAMTVLADSIYTDPTQIADKPTVARTLAALVHTDPADSLTTEEQIAARLNDGRNFAWIARRVTPQVAAAVKSQNIRGIYFQKEFQRFYPDDQLAAQVLGYVGVDDDGLGGLEEKFDSDLHGRAGIMNTALDAHRKVLGSTEHEPSPAAISSSPSTRTFSSWPSARSIMRWRNRRPSAAQSLCRTCTAGRFSLSPSGPPSIPTNSATQRPACSATTR